MKYSIGMKWDLDSDTSDTFSVVTRYLNFQSTSIKKNIYYISVSISPSPRDTQNASEIHLPEINIYWREYPEGSWNEYGSITPQAGTQESGLLGGTFRVENKLVGIVGMQIKLDGFLSTIFNIDDINISYRGLRKPNVSTSVI